mgnify:CR=1 FL=1
MNTFNEDHREYKTEADGLIETAIDYWSDGLPLPVDIHTKLVGLGVDVGRLEAQYT